MINLVRLVLKTKGVEVYGALSGEEGLELIPRVKPDLVLLDITQVGMDGWEILRRMQQDETMQTIPAIVMTARARVSDVALGLKTPGAEGV
jgi:CheY-like chemotaxis protein